MADPFMQEDLRRQRWRIGLATLVAAALGAGVLMLLGVSSEDPDVSTAADGSGQDPGVQPAPPTTAAAPTEAPVVVEGASDEEATTTVEAFLVRVRGGNLAGARSLWSGYPNADDDAAILTGIDRFATDYAALVAATSVDTYVTRSGGFTPLPVVTVVAHADGGQPSQVGAFVVGRAAGSGSADRPVLIQRLPTSSGVVSPASGTAVQPNQLLTIEGVPTEGSVAAYVNGSAVTATVNHDAQTTSFELPPWVKDDIVVTISMATPEIPDAHAFWFPVAPG